MARSLNKATLIGNLTRDPELRFTPQGSAVCTFSVATNRQWTTDTGEKKEEAEFHRVVSWNKLAEICAQLLKKGRKVFVEGRLQTRNWTGQDGAQRTTTEIVITDMILLDSRREGAPFDSSSAPVDTKSKPEDVNEGWEPSEEIEETKESKKKPLKTKSKKGKLSKKDKKSQKPPDEKTAAEEDIPF